MITNKLTHPSPAPKATSPYGQRLRSLAELQGIGAEVADLLAGMIRCVDSAGYGYLRTLYRCLPMVHRQQLGMPPSCREQDAHAHLQW
jgi:hypothetical protein